ncbi:Major Facilitator Superfamily Domain-Containing Protein 6 [Manis pentadactyla]|nr:Major Facilitator Superfamily Domain-Containing Protein 6 [Manis pentadactyla]
MARRKSVEFPSFRILGTRQMHELGADVPGNEQTSFQGCDPGLHVGLSSQGCRGLAYDLLAMTAPAPAAYGHPCIRVSLMVHLLMSACLHWRLQKRGKVPQTRAHRLALHLRLSKDVKAESRRKTLQDFYTQLIEEEDVEDVFGIKCILSSHKNEHLVPEPRDCKASGRALLNIERCTKNSNQIIESDTKDQRTETATEIGDETEKEAEKETLSERAGRRAPRGSGTPGDGRSVSSYTQQSKIQIKQKLVSFVTTAI